MTRHPPEAVKGCALYAVGNVGDALCAEVLEVVSFVFEMLKCVRCVLGAAEDMRRALEVLEVVLELYVVAALYVGGGEG